MEQNNSYSHEVLSEQTSAQYTIYHDRHAKETAHATTVRSQLSTDHDMQ